MEPRAEKADLNPEPIRRLFTQGYPQQPAPAAEPEASGASPGPASRPGQDLGQFHLLPEELISFLDQYVVEQDEAKAILATKICTHFNRLRLPPDPDEQNVGIIKNNVLMVGPTGVGKTYLVKLIARRLGVPFVKADATKFSETGYVGGDVEDLVRELVREAQGDVERAQYGIVYLDEIDKIAATRNLVGPDVSRSGVQRNLLKLMEETEVDLRSPHDLTAQMESVLQMQRTGKLERKKVNTRHILFVVSGAFSGLEELVARRLNQAPMGFHAVPEQPGAVSDPNLLRQVRAEDLIEYGFESEFVGRLPVVAVLDELRCEDLLAILRNPKSNVVLSKQRDFRAYGIELVFTDDALRLLAQRAYEERTGARGLVSALEKVLLPFERRLPSTGIERLEVTEAVVRDPLAGLEAILFEGSLAAFVERFRVTHGIRLLFPPESTALLAEMVRARGCTPDELCSQLFSDYGHGLKLMDRTEYAVAPGTLAQPRETLNQLIVEHYSRGR
jgi:endopeptidase Clp ATP-binding regulatory subunit ClpX